MFALTLINFSFICTSRTQLHLLEKQQQEIQLALTQPHRVARPLIPSLSTRQQLISPRHSKSIPNTP